MLYRCYVKEGTDEYDDFENNYKSQCTEVDSLIVSGTITFLKNITWDELKSMVDGENVKWSDVKFKKYRYFYELWLEQ